MIHGSDVARAILAAHAHFDRAAGERWLLTDMRVYDWWDLCAAWGDENTKAEMEAHRCAAGVGEMKVDTTAAAGSVATETLPRRTKGPHARWVRELMKEEGVRALPRAPEQLGRALDSTGFWNTFELEPVITRLE